ncbi:MAG: cytochrome c oxidase assembly factor 1 family protein [Flavobacteriaceae bacterium]|nr:cytochrome c oxidase assembly factor 1 family protein [Flavobacteriaceae bacterium]
MNALISKKPWLNRNWKWLIPLLVLFSGIALILALAGNGISSVVAVYSESEIYKDALEIANKNEEVKQKLGDLEPIDFFAIAECVVKYSNNNNSVDISVRVKGSKGKGRIDISADRKEDKWEYQRIQIRIKKPKETIKILE